MPSEFLNLPDYSGGYVTGVHLVRGVAGVFKSTSHHKFPNTDPADDFHPRDDGEQTLAPWTAEDERRLGMDEDDDDDEPTGGRASAKPRPDEPNLGSLGRVSF